MKQCKRYGTKYFFGKTPYKMMFDQKKGYVSLVLLLRPGLYRCSMLALTRL